MSISGLEAVTGENTQLASLKTQVMDKDDFLNLLIAQLKNQDPLNPTDSTEFTAQLAQFSSLEQLGNVNDNLKSLQLYQASINNSQTVSFIGKNITARGNTMELKDGAPSAFDFKLASNAATVTANIYDASGEFVTAFDGGALAAGRHVLAWDGTDKDGNRMPAGVYHFEIMAEGDDNQEVGVTPYTTATVSAVDFSDDTAYLIAGRRRIALGDVVSVSATGN